ncbi:hypothetical protein T01_7671 [Trichinella spiralis]|uniref:Uncharacterized protein n=1 Tax=Trichinella spiralis TaxID=6334 RepID=A0A0V0YXA8_TRISP|nr:hypothetical protein T01_7671 [Trichinella spiralis]
MTFYDGSKASLVNEFDNEESYAAIIMRKLAKSIFSSICAAATLH